MPPRNRFVRPLGQRRYRKLFVIAVEGAKTEPQYFAVFNDSQSVIHVDCLRGRHDSSPGHVLKRTTQHLQKESLRESDEAWLVVDKDQWTDDQLAQLHEWSRAGGNRGLAVSNPKFEYWLLLHYEDGVGITSSDQCSARLRQYIPDYRKGIVARRISPQRVRDAIRRAMQRDNPPCADWPRTLGSTTVYKLVERILGTP